MNEVDITKLEPWIVELVRAQSRVELGGVDFSVYKSKGRVSSIKTSTHKIVTFRGADNKEPMVYIADLLNQLPKDCGATLRLSIESNNGSVNKIVVNNSKKIMFDESGNVC